MSGLQKIKDEYIVIFRYKTHGSRFEMLCRREETANFLTDDGRLLHSVVDDDAVLAKILQKPTIFSNAKKKEIATQSSLHEAFGDKSTVREVILQILTKGEVVETQRDRDVSKSHMMDAKEQILGMLPQMLLNPFSGVHPDPLDVKDAMNTVLSKWKPTSGVPPVVEAGFIASQIAHKIDCVRVAKKVVFTYDPSTDKRNLAAWHDFIIGFAPVVTSVDSFTVAGPSPPQHGESVATSNPAYYRKEILLVDAMLLAQDPTWERLCGLFAVSVEEVKITEEETKQFSETIYDPPAPVYVFGGSHSADVQSPQSRNGTDVPPDVAAARAAKQRELYESKPDSLAAIVLNRQVGEPEVVFKGNAKKNGGKGKHQDSDDDNEVGSKRGRGGKGNKNNNGAGVDIEADFAKKTHKELQDLCKKKGMSTGGKKEDLIDRLVCFEMNK